MVKLNNIFDWSRNYGFSAYITLTKHISSKTRVLYEQIDTVWMLSARSRDEAVESVSQKLFEKWVNVFVNVCSLQTYTDFAASLFLYWWPALIHILPSHIDLVPTAWKCLNLSRVKTAHPLVLTQSSSSFIMSSSSCVAFTCCRATCCCHRVRTAHLFVHELQNKLQAAKTEKPELSSCQGTFFFPRVCFCLPAPLKPAKFSSLGGKKWDSWRVTNHV